MKPSLTYLFLTFLRIGATSWGGFMALISMIQKKIVENDGKVDNEVIMEGISLASVLPGPMAVNVVSFVGYKLGGIKGALVSIAGVLIPSFLLMLALSHLYLKYGDIPAMNHFFAGILPAVAAIILSVALSMGEKNIKDMPQVAIALISAILVTISKSYLTTLAILLVSGTIGYFYYGKENLSGKNIAASHAKPDNAPGNSKYNLSIILSIIAVLLAIMVIIFNPANPDFDLQKNISLTFSGMSLTQFGGGYVIIPTMQKIVVNGMKWLTDKEFVDAIAMGQITPGPIFISATFIGYKLAGFWGALNATISIFFPTAVLTIFFAKFFNQINKSVWLVAVFKGLRPAIIGMIISAAFTIMFNNGFTLFSITIFAISLLSVMRFKIDPAYIIPVAGILGFLIL